MEQKSLADPLKDILEDFKAYIENLITYNKLVFVRGASELSSYLMLLIVLFGISGFVLLFFSFAFAGWFGHITGWGIGAGYLVVAVFYLLLAFIVFHYRKPLIFNPARKLFGSIFFDDFNNGEFNLKFDTEDSHSESVEEVQKKLHERKEELNKKFKEFEENLTLSNIVQEILGKAYSSIMTTSNIARFVFTIIRKFKGSGKKKDKSLKKAEKKRNKKRLSGKEDENYDVD